MANICCLIYYTIATIQSLPTIFRIIKHRQSTDISLISTYLGFIAGTAWTIYIFLTEQTTLVYIGTVWDMLICIVYTITVILYHDDNPFRKHRNKERNHNESSDKET